MRYVREVNGGASPAGSRPDLCGVVLEIPAHQWWGDEAVPLRILVVRVDDTGTDDPYHGWVRVDGYRLGTRDDHLVRVLVQAMALPAGDPAAGAEPRRDTAEPATGGPPVGRGPTERLG